jgi:hypothetical protein
MQLTDANPPQETAMTTTHVLKIVAILKLDVLTLQSLATKMMLVLFLTAALLKDANTNQRTVTTTTHVPRIAVQTDNVFTLKLLVMIKMHVLKIVVMQLLDADLFLFHAKTQTCVPSELVMQLKESLIPQETVKMETDVL